MVMAARLCRNILGINDKRRGNAGIVSCGKRLNSHRRRKCRLSFTACTFHSLLAGRGNG
jgi:hypothetical protein